MSHPSRLLDELCLLLVLLEDVVLVGVHDGEGRVPLPAAITRGPDIIVGTDSFSGPCSLVRLWDSRNFILKFHWRIHLILVV